MSQQPIKVYSLSTCGHCKSAKKLMSDNGIEFESVEVDKLVGEERTAMIQEIRGFNPRCSFPTIVIGDKVFVGFRENELKEALGLS